MKYCNIIIEAQFVGNSLSEANVVREESTTQFVKKLRSNTKTS